MWLLPASVASKYVVGLAGAVLVGEFGAPLRSTRTTRVRRDSKLFQNLITSSHEAGHCSMMFPFSTTVLAACGLVHSPLNIWNLPRSSAV